MSDEEKAVSDVNPEDILGADDDQANLEEPASPEPTEESAEESPLSTEEPTEPVEEAPAVEPAEELVPYKVSWNGQEFELKVTPAQVKVLDAQRTTALQFPHLQQKYNQVLQASQNAAQMANVQPAQPKEGEQFDPKAFTDRMKPILDDARKRGALSEEFAELYPVEAAGYAFGMWQLQQVGQILAPLVQHYSQTTLEAQRSNFKAQVFDNMQRLASENPDIYGDLNDHDNRERYLQFLAELDLQVSQFQGDSARTTLERLWPSFKGPELIAAAKAAASRAKAQQSAKRQNASGAGGGGGQRTKPKTGLEDIAAILGD